MLVLMVTMLAVWGICLSFIEFRHIRQIDELRFDRDRDHDRIATLNRQVRDLRKDNLPLINRAPKPWWESMQADADTHNGV